MTDEMKPFHSEMEWVVVDGRRQSEILRQEPGLRAGHQLFCTASAAGQGQRSLCVKFESQIFRNFTSWGSLEHLWFYPQCHHWSPFKFMKLHFSPAKFFTRWNGKRCMAIISLGFAPLYFLLYRGGYWAMGMDTDIYDMTNPPLGGCGGESWRCTRNELRSLGLFPSCVMAWKKKTWLKINQHTLTSTKIAKFYKHCKVVKKLNARVLCKV